EGRAVDLLGLPRAAGHCVLHRGPARLRRGGGDGRPRRDQPGRRGCPAPVGVPRDAGLCGARPDAARDPAGLGDRPLGQARAQRGD
ncbi:MAG: Sugar phosphate isomerases/epimerases, partial [uncultured Nocardioidaceae bacterium]